MKHAKSLCLATVTLIAAIGTPSAQAITPLSLEVGKPPGQIIVSTDSLPNMEIRADMRETSRGTWGMVPVKEMPRPSAGASVVRSAIYTFPDGSDITHTVQATIDGQTISVNAAWPTSINAAGFSRADLWIPQELAEDIKVTMGDKKLYPLDASEKPQYAKNAGKLVFTRTSTGQILFDITGDFVNVIPNFYKDKPDKGVTFQIGNIDNAVLTTASISSATSLNWQLRFAK